MDNLSDDRASNQDCDHYSRFEDLRYPYPDFDLYSYLPSTEMTDIEGPGEPHERVTRRPDR